VHAISLRPATVDAEQLAYLARKLVLERVRVIAVEGVDVGRLDVQEGDDEIFLAVNHRAYRLYRRLGFTESSRDGVAPEVRIRIRMP
jgi:ribosomal protein S18 acetylase RimI-like enzyme